MRLVAVLGVFATALTLAVVPAPATAARKPGLRQLGNLPIPPPTEAGRGQIVQVDSVGRRLYYLYESRADGTAGYLIEFDLRTAIPQPLRKVRVANPSELPSSFSPYTVGLDRARRRLLVMIPTQVGVNEVRIVDLKTFKMAEPWNISATVPGFLPMGMTFSARDDRVYLVGEMSHSILVGSGAGGRKAVGPGTAIVALDAATGELVWVRPLPQCQQVLDSFGVGALVARSSTSPHLYLACVTGGLGNSDTFPGQSGVLRLTISGRADQAEAFGSRVEFFPISGAYSGSGDSADGLAAFDRGTDRFFLLSLARATPGTWVFDGRMSAWVGFISAPNEYNRWLGLNESSGHFYSGTGTLDDYLLVADGRATPVPQGTVTEFTVDGFIVTDPGSRRLFVPDQDGAYIRYRVLVDETPEAQPLRPPDYDALTADVPEGPNTTTSYSGGVNGFGIRIVLVGGYGGIVNLGGEPVQIGDLRQGDRGLTTARVPTLDLREVGAAATAQAVVEDGNTEAELSDRGLQSPAEPATCLDGSGQAVEQSTEGPGGSAYVLCDLRKQAVGASTQSGALSTTGISVAASSFSTRARRDPHKGAVTETVAVSEGVNLSSPQGSVHIDRVEVVATTRAHGRPDTAKASWERVISGIEIQDSSGEVTRVNECRSSDDAEDTCEALVAAINEALQVKMRVDLFEPDVVATPKGAFAGVQQSDADFYHGRAVYNQGTTFSAEAASRAVPALQVTVFNDAVERSRLIVQLAGVQANSIYTISPRPPLPKDGAPVSLPSDTSTSTSAVPPTTNSAGVSGGSGGSSAPSSDVSQPTEPAELAPVASGPIEGVLAVLTRSPGEAILVGGVWLIFGAAALSLQRRRALLALLARGGRP
ncbi:MAG: hypothetical protein ACRDJI_06120 [Actinomycetota bacterium]